MKYFKVIILVGLLGWSLEKKKYKNYLLVDVFAYNSAQASSLRDLMTYEEEIDFWSEPKIGMCRVMIKKGILLSRFISILKTHNITYNVKITDVQKMIDDNFEEIEKLNSLKNQSINLDNFNNLDSIYAWMDELPDKCPKEFTCQVYNIGESYKNIPIKALKISKPGEMRKSWYLDATTHAREWITTATIMKIINHLMNEADNNAKDLLNKYDWYFVPVVNADGYEYSWNEERTWRKNRRQLSKCIGVDLNRNFNSSNWGKEGASGQECSQTYMGPSAASESETRAVSKELARIGKNILVLLSLHSYGNMYLIPYGNTVNYDGKLCQRTFDHDEIMASVTAAVNATAATFNTIWTGGNSCEIIYATTGGTDDFAKEKIGIKYSIVPELRGNSFVLPPSQIHPSFIEMFNGIVALDKNIKALI